MYHTDDDYFVRFNQPSSSAVHYPSESRHSVADDASSRLRSHSADARRSVFHAQPRTTSEEQDAYWTHAPRTADVYFPSTRRPPTTPTAWLQNEQAQQFNNHAHSFGEHLRERSPGSGSALLDLLSRYPSAQQSVRSSPTLQGFLNRVHPAEQRTVKTVTYNPTSDSRFPLVEYSIASPAEGYQTSSRAYNNFPTTNGYHNNFEPSSSPHRSDQRSPVVPRELNGTPSYLERSFFTDRSTSGLNPAPTSFENRSEQHKFYNGLPAYHTQLVPATGAEGAGELASASRVPLPPDASKLDYIAAVLLDDEMSRSTSEWSKSFGQLQNRFQTLQQPDDYSSSFATSGSLTLPRKTSPLTKSSSNYEMNSSLLGRAVDRRAAEAPEPRKSGALDTFWSQTINQRPSSPTIQRIPSSLTAAERLQLLHEPIDGEPRPPQRVGSGHAVAARRAQLLENNVEPPVERPRTPLNPSFPAKSFLVPNFNELDRAVIELSNSAQNVAFGSDNGNRIGGCARFPTGEHAFSPPPQVDRYAPSRPTYSQAQRKLHSPSPTESNSDSSSVYQIPTGLPHPKPKHNVKEQLHQAGIQSTNFYTNRFGFRNAPNFPVPSTGSVASRITEFEKRPGTPTLQIASSLRYTREPSPTTTSNGSMSPRSAVFRSKPVIHVDLGTTQHAVQQQHNHNSTHSMFDFTSNSISAASATQIHADVSPPSKYTTLAELHVASPPKRTNSAPASRLNINGSLDANGNYGRNAASQNDLAFAAEATSTPLKRSTLDALAFSEFLDEQYRPAPRLPKAPVKQQPRLVAPKEPFHFPQGKPVSQLQNDSALRRVCDVFRTLPGQKCELEHMPAVCAAAGLPLYWKMPIFMAITNEENRPATQVDFTSWWKAMTSVAHDEAARFVYTLTQGSRSFLVPEDLYHMVMDVIHTHPGLAFYREATEFHDKYCQVVMTRIFWNDSHSWSGRLTTERLRRGGVLQAIRDLAVEDDINKSLRYFSYEHFYVVYCKFWEIDTDHDLKIRKKDLAQHAGGALVPLVVDRVFSGAVCMTPMNGTPLDEIGLPEFTQFLLAEEDKTHPTSVEYWFRILDLDGDGVVTLYDMEMFHAQVQKKLAHEGIDSMAFPDVACQLIDMLNVSGATSFRLGDLKKSPLRGRFINTFVNWRKFFVQETNEGSEAPRIEDEGGQELTEWDRYCIEEYEAMMEDDQADAETISLNLEEDDSKTSLAYHDLL